jgi:putative FmdB family regulatory protein
MPKYTYKCSECEVVFETRHSMSEELTDCTECETDGTLKKVPSMFISFVKKTGESKNSKVGELTKEKIEEFRKDLNKQKKDMREDIV